MISCFVYCNENAFEVLTLTKGKDYYTLKRSVMI